MSQTYYVPTGGLPAQSDLMTGRAVFTDAYCVIPKGCFSDIVTSYLPGWTGTRAWIIARPMTGFAETFSHYVMEVSPGGGSDAPEPEAGAEGVLFVTEGRLWLRLGPEDHEIGAGAYVYLPPGTDWRILNRYSAPGRFHWIRKIWEPAQGVEPPPAFLTSDYETPISWMPGTANRWGTTRFADPDDLRHDMHVNIVTFEPGGVIPFEETHVMEHGLYVLEGKAVYKLNRDWVEVEAGDYMWLRAYCPQACYAGGPARFRYLLYKDVNRHAKLRGPGGFAR